MEKIGGCILSLNDGVTSLNSQRSGFLDYIRGILIITVVWGHAIQYFSLDAEAFYEDCVYKIIYSFHMPLFMMISGYVFYWSITRNKSVVLLKKRVLSIGTPMLLWGGEYAG